MLPALSRIYHLTWRDIEQMPLAELGEYLNDLEVEIDVA